MSDLIRSDATAIRSAFTRGDASAAEIVESHLKRIEETEPSIGAFITLMGDEARRRARELDGARRSGEDPGPLAAVPVAIKDVLCVKGVPATCGSRILEGFVPPYDASCVSRLREAGAVILGKTNMDEFAMGSSTEHSAYKQTRNPWDLDRVPGGSSGGSAAAVASFDVPLALGSDTGGSIRQPAAFTGTVGLKPTYGRVSRYGLVAFASSLDQVGPIARSVRDAALALSVIAGPDERDMTCAPAAPGGYVVSRDGDLKGLRVGVPVEFFGEGLDPEIDRAVKKCHEALSRRGAALVEVSLPSTEYAIATYYIVATSEASSNLARYDGVRYGFRDRKAVGLGSMYDATRELGFGDEVKRRIMLGTYSLASGYYDAYYLKAMKARALIRKDFERAFESVDILVGPTTPTPAFRLGEKLDDPLSMYLMDIYTATANLSGIPGLSLPCGFSETGLPIGCQLLAPWFEEARLLSVAAVLEEALGVSGGAPSLAVDT